MAPWVTPSLEEIDMNAEIGGYSPDFVEFSEGNALDGNAHEGNAAAE